jgi:hypothetical protein
LLTESAEYLDMTSGGVFVHCTVEEGKLILDRILSVTLLEDLQLKAPHISEEEPIITYHDASKVSTSPTGELLQLTAPEISSNKEEDNPTPFHLSIKEDCFEYDIENLSKAPTYDKKGLFSSLLDKIERNSWFLKETSNDCLLYLAEVDLKLLRKTTAMSGFILVPTLSVAACKDSCSRRFVMIQGWN